MNEEEWEKYLSKANMYDAFYTMLVLSGYLDEKYKYYVKFASIRWKTFIGPKVSKCLDIPFDLCGNKESMKRIFVKAYRRCQEIKKEDPKKFPV